MSSNPVAYAACNNNNRKYELIQIERDFDTNSICSKISPEKMPYHIPALKIFNILAKYLFIPFPFSNICSRRSSLFLFFCLCCHRCSSHTHTLTYTHDPIILCYVISFFLFGCLRLTSNFRLFEILCFTHQPKSYHFLFI